MAQRTPGRDAAPYPLKLERALSPRLWGGTRLERFLDLDEPWAGSEPLGEVWQVYAENRITNGALAGATLAEAARACGAALLGSAVVSRYGRRVPLLAKFIDAAAELSIQVHPDDAYALSREAGSGHLGKAEAWLILEAAPGASIVWGFDREVSAAEVREAATSGRLEPLVRRVPVAAGDVIYNPPGTVHAIGAGIFLFEIQQSSDLTYRLYDYGRKDASGRTRELHLDKALDVADLRPRARAKVPPRQLGEAGVELVRTPFFVMERWELAGRLEMETSPDSLEILTVVQGGLELEAGGLLRLRRGESAVLPATLGGYRLSGRAVVLRCYVPGDGFLRASNQE